jgi:hypothetical protein
MSGNQRQNQFPPINRDSIGMRPIIAIYSKHFLSNPSETATTIDIPEQILRGTRCAITNVQQNHVRIDSDWESLTK